MRHLREYLSASSCHSFKNRLAIEHGNRKTRHPPVCYGRRVISMIGTFIGGLMLGLVPTYVLLPLLAATFIAPYAAPGLITALGTVGITVGPLAAQALVAGGIIPTGVIALSALGNETLTIDQCCCNVISFDNGLRHSEW